MAYSVSNVDSVWTGPELCETLVLYEDTPARDLALRVCDRLVANFRPDLQFQFTWAGFKYLQVPEIAGEIGQNAARADLLLLSLPDLRKLPLQIISWLGLVLPKRKPTEGALVVLESAGMAPGEAVWQKPHLQALASRSGLDYLHLPTPKSTAQVSDKLREDQLIPDTPFIQPPTHQYHSSGWGINE